MTEINGVQRPLHPAAPTLAAALCSAGGHATDAGRRDTTARCTVRKKLATATSSPLPKSQILGTLACARAKERCPSAQAAGGILEMMMDTASVLRRWQLRAAALRDGSHGSAEQNRDPAYRTANHAAGREIWVGAARWA